MRRVLIAIASLIVITSIVFFTYQHIKQQQAKDSSQMFDVVMTEKMNQLYEQAQDWSKNPSSLIFTISVWQDTISKFQNSF